MTDDDLDVARAELFLCLARAFAPPRGEAGEAMRSVLVDDLRELSAACALAAHGILDELDGALAAVADAQSLLASYARLFLVPGDQHPSLNAAAYLDGALGGGSMHDMMACYASCGLARDEGFHDLADHVTVQLEFVAWLFAARAAAALGEGEQPGMTPEAFLARFVVRWLPPLRDDIASAQARFALDASPYRVLADLLTTLVDSIAPAHADLRASATAVIDPEIARLRAAYAGRSPGAADLAEIRARLAADGLSNDHVAIPVEVRDAAMGLEPLLLPDVPLAPGSRLRGGA